MTWSARDALWEENFSRLLDYVESNGDALVPKRYTFEGDRLGAWVMWQRKNYAKGVPDTSRARRLQGLQGWMWNAR
ncbi:helicase associated domain-containing protein [Nocardia sp. NBC_01009]|uniref:helicase associated domain-containing protein n=1 Tax=Nocardia sp. NBC_01009 TaxID=2975996 RepID=UPI00386F94C5